MMYKISKQSGFSLVETLVAITILLIVITGPLTIGITTARSTSFSTEQVVAFFLAQEGAELAQKARDDILLSYFNDAISEPAPWNRFSNSSTGDYKECFGASGCGLELQDTNGNGLLKPLVSCSGTACDLHYNAGGDRARYTHVSAAGVPTKYSRVIKMAELPGEREVKVTATVTWRTGSSRATQQVEVETYLFNVYNKP